MAQAKKKPAAKKPAAKKPAAKKPAAKKPTAKRPRVTIDTKPAVSPASATFATPATKSESSVAKSDVKKESRFSNKFALRKLQDSEKQVSDKEEPSAEKKSTSSPVKSDGVKVAAQKKSAKKGGNPELAEKIRSWARKRRLQKDPYLISLSDALENNEDLAVWASTDILEMFPHAFIKETEGRMYTLAILIRNILVFVPVALTWLAISKATTAFAIYTAKETGDVANFLQFWQDGYGYLSKEWTIGHVAMLDFFIIVGVIVLTFITPIWSHNNEIQAEREEMDSERERIGLAVEVMAFLYDKKEVNNVTMNAYLARSVQQLSQAAKALNEGAKRIEKISKTLPNNATIIQEIRKIGK